MHSRWTKKNATSLCECVHHNYWNHCLLRDKNNDDSLDISFSFIFIFSVNLVFSKRKKKQCWFVGSILSLLFYQLLDLLVACWNWFNSHIVCIFKSNQLCAKHHLLFIGHSIQQRSMLTQLLSVNKFSALIAFVFLVAFSTPCH